MPFLQLGISYSYYASIRYLDLYTLYSRHLNVNQTSNILCGLSFGVTDMVKGHDFLMDILLKIQTNMPLFLTQKYEGGIILRRLNNPGKTAK